MGWLPQFPSHFFPFLDGKLLTKQEQKQSFTSEREDFCSFSLQHNIFLVRLFFISSFSVNTPKAAERIILAYNEQVSEMTMRSDE